MGRIQVGGCGRRRPPRRHRSRCRRAQGYRAQDHQGARWFPDSPHHPAVSGKPGKSHRHRRRHRLRDRGSAGVLHAAAGGPSRPAVGTGLRARHLLAAALGADRSGRREPLHAVQPSRRRPGPLRSHQLAALGRSRARLRVRLLAGGAERADGLGSAVRRLRQRCAGAVRPVHLVGRAQMAAHVRPHGYEGQGPDHSSARLERFLQMCAEDNMQVVYATTPANFFHVLRRQLHREIRKPLILMTPKSLLRHKRAVSRLDEMGADTTFHRLLYDDAAMLPDEKIKLVADDKIKRVVLCSGKVYYDIYDEREKRGIDDVYIMRVEQLYPVPLKALVQELGRFKNAELVWCQEEPRNMGAWQFMESYLVWVLKQVGTSQERPRYAGRQPSAATATGLMPKHLVQLKALLDEALG